MKNNLQSFDLAPPPCYSNLKPIFQALGFIFLWSTVFTKFVNFPCSYLSEASAFSFFGTINSKRLWL